jgi:hypothetical protein
MISDDDEHSQKASFLRRAARNPWVWGVVVIAAALLVLPVAYFQFKVRSIPDIGEPFDVKRHASLSIPEDANAFTAYRAAANDLSSGAIGERDPLRERAAWTSLEQAEKLGWSAANGDVRKWLERNRSALLRWREGTERQEGVEIQPAEMKPDTLLPITSSLRDLLRLALLEAARLSETGKSQEAWSWYRAALRCSRHSGMHAGIICRLVGADLHRRCAEAILHWAARPDVTADELRRALEESIAIYGMTLPLSDCIKTEYISSFAVPDGQFDEEFAPGSKWIVTKQIDAGERLLLNFTGSTERMRRIGKLMYANWLSQADRPRYARTPIESRLLWLYALSPSAAPNPKLYSPGFIAACFFSTEVELKRLHLPSPSFAPAARGIFRATDAEQTEQSALELALALELYHSGHGEFPATLEPLQQGYLKKIPADPFGHGGPLHYRREAAAGGGATLWSVGFDGVDQGGKPTPDPQGGGDETGDLVIHVAAPRRNS